MLLESGGKRVDGKTYDGKCFKKPSGMVQYSATEQPKRLHKKLKAMRITVIILTLVSITCGLVSPAYRSESGCEQTPQHTTPPESPPAARAKQQGREGRGSKRTKTKKMEQ